MLLQYFKVSSYFESNLCSVTRDAIFAVYVMAVMTASLNFSVFAAFLPHSNFAIDLLYSGFESLFTVNPGTNAPGVYSYNRSEPPAFIRDPAFV